MITVKVTPYIDNLEYFIKAWEHFMKGEFIGDIEIFDRTLEECKVTHPDVEYPVTLQKTTLTMFRLFFCR